MNDFQYLIIPFFIAIPAVLAFMFVRSKRKFQNRFPDVSDEQFSIRLGLASEREMAWALEERNKIAGESKFPYLKLSPGMMLPDLYRYELLPLEQYLSDASDLLRKAGMSDESLRDTRSIGDLISLVIRAKNRCGHAERKPL